MSSPEERLSGIDKILDTIELEPGTRERIAQDLGVYAASLAQRFGNESRVDETLMMQDYIRDADPSREELLGRVAGRLAELARDPMEEIRFIDRMYVQASLGSYDEMKTFLIDLQVGVTTRRMTADQAILSMMTFVTERINTFYGYYNGMRSDDYGKGDDHE